jgi:hypothetical protein
MRKSVMDNYESETNRISKEYIIENNKSDAQLYKSQKNSYKTSTLETRQGVKTTDLRD